MDYKPLDTFMIHILKLSVDSDSDLVDSSVYKKYIGSLTCMVGFSSQIVVWMRSLVSQTRGVQTPILCPSWLLVYGWAEVVANLLHGLRYVRYLKGTLAYFFTVIWVAACFSGFWLGQRCWWHEEWFMALFQLGFIYNIFVNQEAGGSGT